MKNSTTTIQEAKDIRVYIISDGKLVEMTYLDYLEEYGQGDDRSAVEETTVIQYLVDGCDFESREDAEDYCDGNDIAYDMITEEETVEYSHVVRSHANYGRKVRSQVNWGDDREAAEDDYIRGLEWFATEKNCNAPQFFDTAEEAEIDRLECDAERMGVDIDVLRSIESKQARIDKVRADRAEVLRIEQAKKNDLLFNQYLEFPSISQLKKIEGESYKETAARLSVAIGAKIDTHVFHRIVKHVRK